MEVRGGRSASVADEGDKLVLLHFLSDARNKAGKMPIPGCQPIAMIDDQQITVRSHALGVDHLAVGRGSHLSAVERRNVQPQMFFSIAAEWVQALSVMTGDRTLDG